ncbi:hypothetical protein [Gordonia sp. SMJS1]|uniref:hypothetical protein n=1 Tax=Gordonia sp. SMJS1 TaxID=3039400 RepID=UPI00245842A1|nr:hypothetical protein [Gordonia sp. SMJS1]WGJ86993.1 hypothetical protein QAD21_07715 [Gordonia sp. SMJS1]
MSDYDNKPLPRRMAEVQANVWTPEGRAMIRNDREAAVEARRIQNGAALRELEAQLKHAQNKRDISRRLIEAREVMAAQNILMHAADDLARGSVPALLEHSQVYEAWKIGELNRLMDPS